MINSGYDGCCAMNNTCLGASLYLGSMLRKYGKTKCETQKDQSRKVKYWIWQVNFIVYWNADWLARMVRRMSVCKKREKI